MTAVDLGSLSANDLGATLTFTDGGATYSGMLKGVQHDSSLSGALKTLVVLSSDDWRHIKSYPSSTPCVVTPVAIAP